MSSRGCSRGRGRGRGRPSGRLDAATALERLSAVSSTQPASLDAHGRAWRMASAKRRYRAEALEASTESERAAVAGHVALVAEVSGIRAPALAQGLGRGRAEVHGKSWSPFSILRAAFTPVGAGAFAQVLETGVAIRHAHKRTQTHTNARTHAQNTHNA